MLVKMASSKSTIKTVTKTQLYFNKYRYRATVKSSGVYWIRLSKNITDFTRFVLDKYEEWEQQKDRYPNGWYRKPTPLIEHDLDLIENILKIKNSLKKKDARFRHEHETFSIYTNDDKLIRKLAKDTRWEIEQAETSPIGVKYFKKDPPAKYRAYMSSNKVDSSILDEMIEYFNRTPDLDPSNAFYEWLHRRRKWNHNYIWMWNNHFIDYNDERNLMMLKLMFPEAIGKTYKLEKKP